MASLSRRSESAALQTTGNSAISIGASRSTNTLAPSDPLQPLRAMADRVGKEVEKFAERVDHWHTHGNEDLKAKYQTTVKMVGKFRDLAESTVKELKKHTGAENKGELDKSVRRRIQDMADEPSSSGENSLDQSLQSVVPSVEPSAAPDSSSVRELRQWQAELATWELLRIIIEHYHPQPGTDVVAEKRSRLQKVGGAMRYCPKSEIWDRFILEDDQAREKKVILKWLQQTAKNSENDIESITEQLEELSGKDTQTWTSGWLDTKSKIKQFKRVQGLDHPLDSDFTLQSSDRTLSLVTQLDPDAPTRQKRNLEKSDEYYERALWMVCYEMLRRGEPWDKVADWCKERNEAWRGVSVGAAYDSHPDGGPNVAGNDIGYLFRRMCFHAARGARIPYEAAVYGLLSGDLKQVQTVCRSWDDHLHAHYNALLLSRFDNYLQKGPSARVSQILARKFVFQDETAKIGNWETANSHVIELLKQNKATAAQAVSPMKLIQGALISRTEDELIYKVGIAIADMLQGDDRLLNLIIDPDSEETPPSSKMSGEHRRVNAERYHQTLANDPQALRILVHVFITLQNGLGLAMSDTWQKKEATFNVIAAYIEFLRITNRTQLIPLYASQLDSGRAVHCLSRVMPDIKNIEERKRCVTLMEQYRVNTSHAMDRNIDLALRGSGLVSGPDGTVANPISRFTMLEGTTDQQEPYLWPGQRIKLDFSGLDISAGDEAVIESVQWFNHLNAEDDKTFGYLYHVLKVFLLNGRLGAAEKLITEMSVENVSLVKTAMYCGYAFDFTQAGAEEQDETQVTASMHKSLSASGRGSVRPSQIVSAQEHTQLVQWLRGTSAAYFDLQQLVRLITLFRHWRSEEELLIADRANASTEGIKDLFRSIEATFPTLLEPSFIPTRDEEMYLLYKAYLPDLVISYLSVMQTGSYFIHRESAIKAMDVAAVVADEDKEWIRKMFLDTGKMSLLVDTLAQVGKAMLKLAEHPASKRAAGKKRGSKGETLKIWDVNVRN